MPYIEDINSTEKKAHGIAKNILMQPRIPGKNVQAKVDSDIVKSGNSDVLVIPVHVYT